MITINLTNNGSPVVFKAILILLVSLLILFFGAKVVVDYNTTGQCERLEKLVRNNELDIQKVLTDWVEDNIENANFTNNDITSASGRAPGHYRLLQNSFDWKLLSMDPEDGQIRILGSIKRTGEIDVDNIQSVSFSDRSRVSVLVRTASSDDFGVFNLNKEFVRPVTPLVAIYCGWE